MMGMYETIMQRRSIRKFKQESIDKSILYELVRAASFAPTGANVQPLSFGIITDKALLDGIFPLTAWAGYFKGEYTPHEGERPVAYIAVFADKENAETAKGTAAGAAIENLLLLAQDKGIGSCWLGAVKHDEVAHLIGLPEDMKLLYLVALGYPAEHPVVCDFAGDIKYFINADGVLTVPKKTQEQVMIIDK